MKIGKTIDYAMRIIEILADHNNVVGAKEISELTGITYKYLMKILGVLKVKGYVVSIQGSKGGYLLKPDRYLTLFDLIEMYEDIELGPDCTGCQYMKYCGFRKDYDRLWEKIGEMLMDFVVLDTTKRNYFTENRMDT